MKRTEATGSIDGAYIDRNTELGIEGTVLVAKDRNALQEEICHVIEAANQTLDDADLYQLLKAVTLKLGSVAETITGVKTFSDIPVLPSGNPTTANQATRKGYVDGLDGQNMKLSGDQTASGVKTFNSIPVLPASNPSSNEQATRKGYVDSSISTAVSAHAGLTNNPHSVTAAQLGLGTGNSPSFVQITTTNGPNPPADNNDATPPAIGVGGFTYVIVNIQTGFNLPSGGTYVVIYASGTGSGRADVLRLAGGGHVGDSSISGTYKFLVMRIA